MGLRAGAAHQELRQRTQRELLPWRSRDTPERVRARAQDASRIDGRERATRRSKQASHPRSGCPRVPLDEPVAAVRRYFLGALQPDVGRHRLPLAFRPLRESAILLRARRKTRFSAAIRGSARLARAVNRSLSSQCHQQQLGSMQHRQSSLHVRRTHHTRGSQAFACLHAALPQSRSAPGVRVRT